MSDASGVPLPIDQCRVPLQKVFVAPAYNLSVNYQWTPDILTYIAHRRGYRAGGFNARGNIPADFVPFKPETVRDIEVGIKADYALGPMRLRSDLAVYNSWYSQIQRSISYVNNGIPSSTITNAATATIKGFEFTQTVQPWRDFTIVGRLGYVDAVQNRFSSFDVATNLPVTVNNVPFGVAKWTGNVSATYTLRSAVAQIEPSANVSFTGHSFSDESQPILEPQGELAGYALLNFGLSFNEIGGRPLSVHFFVDNALNKTYAISSLSLYNDLGIVDKIFGEPRMYGASLSYKFSE
jgi:iron complex outermembrane receptor protein